MKILLAVDGSPYTQKMLSYLVAHQNLFDASHEYTVFTVHAALPPHARAAVGKEIVTSYYADETREVLTPAIEFLTGHGLSVNSDWKVGPAGETIARFAEAGQFDLLVMGSHGHSALGSLVMGSVTSQVLANCKVPVLLVR